MIIISQSTINMKIMRKLLISFFYRLVSYSIRIKIKLFVVKEILSRHKGYNKWIKNKEDYAEMECHLEYMPLISIILPVYNVEECHLRECIESVIQQTYPNWELCIADDNSTKTHIKLVLEEYKALDKRIRVFYRKENGHISASSNSALELVTGEFTALLDNDDVLAPFALQEVINTINSNKNIDLIYSDEDKIQDGLRCFPFFKRKYSKHLLYHINFVCHFAVYRTSLIKSINGFRVGYEGVQDWDLALRVMQLTDRIAHIPKILYHWRITETSTAGGEHRKSYIKESKDKMLRNIKKD